MAEGAGLLNQCRAKSFTTGSNPVHSATFFLASAAAALFAQIPAIACPLGEVRARLYLGAEGDGRHHWILTGEQRRSSAGDCVSHFYELERYDERDQLLERRPVFIAGLRGSRSQQASYAGQRCAGPSGAKHEALPSDLWLESDLQAHAALLGLELSPAEGRLAEASAALSRGARDVTLALRYPNGAQRRLRARGGERGVAPELSVAWSQGAAVVTVRGPNELGAGHVFESLHSFVVRGDPACAKAVRPPWCDAEISAAGLGPCTAASCPLAERRCARDEDCARDPEWAALGRLVCGARGECLPLGGLPPTFFRVIRVAPDDTLSLRAAPAASAELLGRLAPDLRCLSHDGLERDNGLTRWRRVKSSSTSGWVSAAFLAPMDISACR